MRAALLVCLALPLLAQTRGVEIKLWPNGAPGFESLRAEEVTKPSVAPANAHLPGNFSVAHYPAIYVFLPPKEKSLGVGVIIAPGGGHRQLVIEKEGWEMADWLNERGIAAFVLKYRLAKAPGVNQYTLAEHVHQDAARAVRLVRSRAAEYGLKATRIGFLGFSAGGEVAGMIGTKFDAGQAQAADPIERVSSRPDFNILIYPWYRPGANNPHEAPLFPIPADAPPHFLLCADDDRSHVEPTVKYYLELEAAKISTELHVHAYGGHGFGLRPTKKPAPVMDWPQMMLAWLEERGLLR